MLKEWFAMFAALVGALIFLISIFIVTMTLFTILPKPFDFLFLVVCMCAFAAFALINI